MKPVVQEEMTGGIGSTGGHFGTGWSSGEGRMDGAVVLDPKRALRTNVRTDFGRMKPKWYIGVTLSGVDR